MASKKMKSARQILMERWEKLDRVGDMWVWKTKTANLQVIEQHLYVAIQALNRHHARWYAFFNTIPTPKDPQDYSQRTQVFGKSSDGGYYLLEKGDGISCSNIEGDKRKLYTIMDDDELIKHVNDNDNEDESLKDFFKKRLSGEIPQATRNDSAIQTYFRIENQGHTVRKVLGICIEMLTRYVRNNYTTYWRRTSFNRLMFTATPKDDSDNTPYGEYREYMYLTVNGHTYLLHINNFKIEIVSAPGEDILQVRV